MARRNQPPDRLPGEIRDHPEVVRACGEWNVGRLFRVVNNLAEEPSKFTVTHIGRVCGLTTSRVVEYMKDTHRVTAVAVIERIADGLRIPGERFGLVPRPWEDEVAANVPILHPAGSDSVAPVRDSLAEPRSIGGGGSGLLGLLGALGGHPFLTPDAGTAELFQRLRETDFDELTRIILLWVQQANPGLSRREVLLKLGIALSLATAAPVFDTGDPDEHQRVELAGESFSSALAMHEHPTAHFERVRRVLIDSDNLFGPAQVIPTAHQQIGIIQGLRQTTRGGDAQELLRMQAKFAEFAGWLHQDQGDNDAARYWTDRALEWSYVARDPDLTVFILGRKSQLAGDMKDAVNAIGLAEAAVDMAAPGTRSAAVATTYAAHGYALAGDESASARSYDRAHALLADAEADPQSSWGWLDPSYIEVQRARSVAALGDYSAAADGFERAIGLLPFGYPRDRGVYLARAALARAGAQDAEHASTLGVEALIIGAETGSGRIRAELRRLARILGTCDTSTAVQFKDAMRDVYQHV